MEQPKLPEFEDRGIFDYRNLKYWDAKKSGYAFKEYLVARSKDPNSKPFVELVDKCENSAGSSSGRIWIPLEGNIQAVIGFPHHMLRDEIGVAFFSPIVSYSIKEACNKYAPGQYCTKFPNDIVCIEHGRKTCGILCRKVAGYSITTFGLDLVAAPEDKDLRKQGLRACCIKNHTANVPDRETLVFDIANEIIKSYKKFDTLEKLINMMNLDLNVFAKKTYRIEMNNPNANIEKDGLVWTSDHPNALCKGYVNGDLYDSYYQFYDIEYFENAKGGDPDAKAADIKTKALKEKMEKENK